MYDFAKDVIRQYTIYAIVRENFESKDFNQSMWEIWDAVNILYKADLEESRLREMIRKLSEEIVIFGIYPDITVCTSVDYNYYR